jgi:isoamylase
MGRPLANPPMLWDIETDPVLAGTKLIAEAWDAAGSTRWAISSATTGRSGTGASATTCAPLSRAILAWSPVAARFFASPDLYGREGALGPEQSINFITCHDGFTLNDLVSYNEKHNLANGEQNRDGANDNRSWNCGVEGPTADPAIEQLRQRQVKNFFAITCCRWACRCC